MQNEIKTRAEVHKELNKDIGNRIQKLRLNKNFTQVDVIEKLNQKLEYDFGDKSLSKYENGDNTLPYDVLIALADIYNVDINYIVTGKKLDFGCHNLKLKKLAELLKECYELLISML